MKHQRIGLGIALTFALGIAAPALAQQAVQWRVEDGGNGHWYQGVIDDGCTWTGARAAAISRGGDLVSLGSVDEADWVYATIASSPDLWRNRVGPRIGLIQDPFATEPSDGWGWSDQTPLRLTRWNPSGFYGQENPVDFGPCMDSDFGGYYGWPSAPMDSWGSYQDGHNSGCHWEDFRSFIIEWSADCNGDGVVDLGQIFYGLVADADANGIPDICEEPAIHFSVLDGRPDPTKVPDAAIREAMLATGYPWRILDQRTNMQFVLIPPGTFVMGSTASDPEATQEEMPAHQVTLTQPFYLGVTEVTQQQWLVMTGESPSYFGGRPNNPVDRVSWNQSTFAAALFGYRLPTEAEWEYACRGGLSDSRYGPLNAIAWWGNGFGGSSGWGTNPVATKLPNGFGLCDMIGNVWEYCQDFWGPYSAGSVIDPIGPSKGTERVGRSGDWYWPALGNRAPYRGPTAPDSLGLASNGVRFAITAGSTGLFNPLRFADCNGDGIVDYGQILQGQLADADSNGIPDLCEVDPCPADINQSGTIDAEDLAYVLFAWGMTGGKAGGADINGDATVDANDLSLVLGSWGSCPE